MPFTSPPSLRSALVTLVSKVLYELEPLRTRRLQRAVMKGAVITGELKSFRFLVFKIRSPVTIATDASYVKPRFVGDRSKSGVGLAMFDGLGGLIGAQAYRVTATCSNNAEDLAIDKAVALADKFIKQEDQKWMIIIMTDCDKFCGKKRNGFQVVHLPREVNQTADTLSKLAVRFGRYDSISARQLPQSVQPLAYEASGAHYGARYLKGGIGGWVKMRFPDFSKCRDFQFVFNALESASRAILADCEGRKEMAVLVMSQCMEPFALLKVAIFEDISRKTMGMEPILTGLHNLLRFCFPLKGKMLVEISLDLAGEVELIPLFKKADNIPVSFSSPSIKMDVGKMSLDHGDKMNVEVIIRASDAKKFAKKFPKKILFPYATAVSKKIPNSTTAWNVKLGF